MNQPNNVFGKTHYKIVIIGAGFGGMVLAAKLKRQGIDDFVLLERAATVGGVWRENTYPGAACDIPSRLYSLSIAQKHDWSRRYPSQPEIKAYALTLPARLGIEGHIRYKTAAQRMTWDANNHLWRVQTVQSESTLPSELTCQFLVTANGGLETPTKTKLPGIDLYSGTAVHTAQWPANLSLEGKRVALIGTGASAIQAGPEIAKIAAQLTIYQRTPPWVMPRFDRAVGHPMQYLLRHLPGFASALRGYIYASHELRIFGFMNHKVMRLLQGALKALIRHKVTNPIVAKNATPNYTLGCKRVLISDDWYPCLNRSNVKLINAAVESITQNGIIDSKGHSEHFDAIIFATGFEVTDNRFGQTVTGVNRITLSEVINGDGLYLGMTSDHLPNFFAMAGNNTATGHNSQIFMLECMADYICAGISASIKQAGQRALQLKPNIAAPYNTQVQQRLKNSVWRSGCKSWYQNAQGKVLIIWPGFTWRFWQRTRRFDLENYDRT